jgi:D-alanyl-D-alanine carboxypeptidase
MKTEKLVRRRRNFGDRDMVCKFLLGLAALSYAAIAQAAPAPAETAARLQALIDNHRKTTPGIRSEALEVRTSAWRWSGATGIADGKSAPMTTNHVFRIASVTKPYTAAAILRLMEMGKIDISKPIAPHISDASVAALKKGGYDPANITVQHLLAHTSGIYDYAEDPKFQQRVMADPTHQWTRIQQIEHAMMHGKPIDAPGKTYGYSDTGYILLGEILERKTGMGLAKAVRTLLRFDRLKLRNTYWEQLESKTGTAPFARHYFGDVDMTTANPSLDLFGGGGIVSNVGDLSTFYRALVRGEIFDDRRTQAVMMTVSDAKQGRGVHGNALYAVSLGGYKCWGHGGFWGQLVAYCPENDVTFALTINQVDVSSDNTKAFIKDLALIIAP